MAEEGRKEKIKQDWPSAGNSWSWVKGAWGFIVLVLLFLCMFENLQNKSFLK